LRRQRSATDCTAIKRGGGGGRKISGGGGGSSSRRRREEEGGGGSKVATISTHHTCVMQELTGARKIKRNSAHSLKISHEFLNMQHNFYTDKCACTYTPTAVTYILIRHKS